MSKPKRKRGARVDVRGSLGAVSTASRAPWYARRNFVLHDDASTLELQELPASVLVFSCTQAPFQHPDALEFLETVRDAFLPDLTICGGDELDLQYLKKAFMSADSDGPLRELEQGKYFVSHLGRIFPRLILLTSNHVKLRIRYAQAQGNIPSAMMRDWRDVIEAPRDWTWRDYVIARNWLFEHGHDIDKGSRGSIQEQTVKRFGRPLSIIRGHIHSELGDHIKPIWVTRDQQIRLVYVSCLMDGRKVNYTRAPTVNGCVAILRGVPHPIPMVTNKRGRWVGRLSDW